MKEKEFKSLPQKDNNNGKTLRKMQSNRVYGKDWLYSGKSKNYPQLLDIRYEKDYKLQKKNKKN
tara:strand:- start:307 stop:498 length:192 start_codon:yes stop_codon:yes gene_type:complete